MSADAALLHALLAELAGHPDGVSSARLCKRLGLRMSVLLRMLAWIGEDPIGDHAAPGWVRTRDDGTRTLVQLTATGQALLASLPHASPAAPEPP
ncbi:MULTISPECIES: hypothetical protein [unclassified Luteimonas]|uniref:hypothetical protein n=1 Tax=unclassified Luteimonas TaxID=2629088 RepID=UPI0018F0DBD8|nr:MULTISPECIES: hypothetical protein [unclassified Luteimonas]MBJ6977794.1 hypothetical protein [Luteimonas sp. MC1895]MBJ6984613.1 hypothetical protein [Luteimonas sp. MC1750]QQO04783.1 hypothetical protein JGR68_07725 [Luteimonas sp. MC1750]